MHYDDQIKLCAPSIHTEKELKETKGKAEGARYCYLGEHSVLMNKNEYLHLELLLKDLVSLVEENVEGNMSIHICEEILKEVRELDNKFLINLCGVRAQALSSGKYELLSYREEISISYLLDAAARHLLKLIYLEEIDEESGYHHLGHIAANVIMISTQLRLHSGITK